MKQLSKELRVAILVAISVIALLLGAFYGAQAYRHHLDQTSYATRAWDYKYLPERYYVIGYVAQSEQTGPEDTLTADIYAATGQYGIPENGGVYIYVASDDFTYRTDCKQIIYAGKDGYEASDFAWDSFFKQYKKAERKYNMPQLPFHFQLKLTPEVKMAAGVEGSVQIVVIPFGEEEDPAHLEGDTLQAWIQKKLSEGDPDGIEIPYYFDGESFHWSPNMIEEIKAK